MSAPNLPLAVSADFPKAMRILFPGASCVDDFRVEDHSDDNGPRFLLVAWRIDAPVPTAQQVAVASAEAAVEEVRSLRRAAYGDPKTGSDGLAIRAMRLEREGDPEAAQAWTDHANARLEIQARFPYPA